MKEVVIVYWSDTGNTKMMAEAVARGASAEGTSVKMLEVAQATKEDILKASAVAFGCPAMGDEVLEESEMEPFISALSGEDLQNKPCVLFGSYDWGDGQWMRDWVDRMKAFGVNLLADGLIIQNTPDTDGLAECNQLGKRLGVY